MLRDYIWSMTLVAVVLMAYTALVVFNKRPAQEARIETARAAASIKAQTEPAGGIVPAAASAPIKISD